MPQSPNRADPRPVDGDVGAPPGLLGDSIHKPIENRSFRVWFGLTGESRVLRFPSCKRGKLAREIGSTTGEIGGNRPSSRIKVYDVDVPDDDLTALDALFVAYHEYVQFLKDRAEEGDGGISFITSGREFFFLDIHKKICLHKGRCSASIVGVVVLSRCLRGFPSVVRPHRQY